MKNKIKYFLALSALSLFALTACGTESYPYVAEDSRLAEEIAALPAETDQALISELSLANADGVYGNVYLPDKIGNATITWWSSNHKVINTHAVQSIAPGKVTRQKEDTTITLEAKIQKENGQITKYSQNVVVKAAPKTLKDSDFEAYLFGHFIGESYGTGQGTANAKATGEQIFFALADVGQGLHFKDMNKSTMSSLKPVLTSNVGELGVRDPYICRSPEGDTFYLIATDLSVYVRGGWNNNANQATKTGSLSITLWESHDLVNWTDARLIKVARDDAGMAWAPEMIYCEETGEYLIFFSSTILEDYDTVDRSKNTNAKIIYRDSVYYTTTRDFVHFGETKQFIPNVAYSSKTTTRNESDQYAKNNDFRKVIDGSVMKIGKYYYSACKDGGNNEDGGGIRIQKTDNLYDGKWDFVQNLASVGFKAQGQTADNKCLEGPEWFYLNKADRQDPKVPEIGLMADFYANTSIGYIPWSTTDVEDIKNANGSWRQLKSGAKKDYSWDSQTKRHGTILRITAEEAARLKEAFPIK